jgi:hypothetical protein
MDGGSMTKEQRNTLNAEIAREIELSEAGLDFLMAESERRAFTIGYLAGYGKALNHAIEKSTEALGLMRRDGK